MSHENYCVKAAWEELKRQRPQADDLSDGHATTIIVYDGFNLRDVVIAVLQAYGECSDQPE